MKPLWMERYAETERILKLRRDIFGQPSLFAIRQSIETFEAALENGTGWTEEEEFALASYVEHRYHIGDWVPSISRDHWTPLDPLGFRFIPVVSAYLERARALAEAVGMAATMEDTQSWHLLYHLFHFHNEGKRVYVLERKLYDLLRDTTLPNWDFHELNFPLNSFYVKLPDDTFSFNVAMDPTPQPCEGVLVTIDKTKGDPNESRDMSMLFCGTSKYEAWDDNIAYGSVGVGPHAKLDEIRLVGFDNVTTIGGEKIEVEIPHVLFSLILYLQSAHPDIAPVAPPRRRKFGDIRSAHQREVAEKREDERLRNLSKLGYIHIGKNIKSWEDRATTSGTGHRLTERHKVPGHWKQQAFGPQWRERKKIWIEPYWRGPDMADATHLRAAKVPDANKKPPK